MEELLSLKSTVDDFEVEFDIIPAMDADRVSDYRQRKIINGLSDIEAQIEINKSKLDEINADIDRLTNHADGLDYTVAVASGIIAGAVDSVWVGAFSLDRANIRGDRQADDLVIKIARSQGYKGDDLAGAIKYLEDKYHLASDSALADFGGGLQHHLRDFAHHPTPIGLIFSLLTQFTGKAYGTDTSGRFIVVEIPNKTLIGKDIPQKLLFGVVYWVFHLISDMAGSHGSAGGGTGLPGPLVSMLKELSALPFFKNIKIDDIGFSQWISKLFNGTLLAKRDEKGKIVEKVRFDLRTEIGVAGEIGRQAIPVIINECIVRGFYFVRRFFFELRDKNIKSLAELEKIDWQKTLPYKNRTVIRMLTISTGTFTAIDLADAAVRSAVDAAKTGGAAAPVFLSNMLLRVNFVGLGRFAVAIGSDISMGVKKGKLENERIRLHEEQIALTEAKLFYRQADMWISAENAGKTIEQAYGMMEEATQFFVESMREISDNLDRIGEYASAVRERNPVLLEEINDILEWG